MRVRSSVIAGVCAALWWVGGQAAAQDEEEAIRWRREVDHLISRWSDDVGGDRLRQARVLLERRVREGDDAEARLELARVELALPELRLKDRTEAARQLALRYQAARELADRAAAQLATRDPEGKLVDDGGQRYQTALALGLLALQRHFQEELRWRGMTGAKPAELQPLIQSQGAELGERRRRLEEVAGEHLGDLLAREARRIEALRDLDRLGSKSLPIGARDLDDQPIDLSAYLGQPVLIVFWSTTFPPCEPVIEAARRLEERCRERKLTVVAINLDAERPAFDAFLAKQSLPFRHVHDPRGLTGDLARAWRVRALPDGVLLDHTGRVRYVRPWEDGPGWLDAAADELLARRDAAVREAEARDR